MSGFEQKTGAPLAVSIALVITGGMFRRTVYSFALLLPLLAGCASQQASGSGPTLGPRTAQGDATTVNDGSPQASPEENKNLIKVAEEIDIDAPIDQIWPVFDDPESYWKILPMVKGVKPRGQAQDGAMLVELTQGVAFVSGSYTARIFKIRPYEIELAIDHNFPSVLRDGRGFVEMKSAGENRTHVTFRMTVDIGDGWALHLLKDRIREALTRPPSLLKKHVEKR